MLVLLKLPLAHETWTMVAQQVEFSPVLLVDNQPVPSNILLVQ